MYLNKKTIHREVNNSGIAIESKLLHQGFIDFATQTPEKEAVLWVESGVWKSINYASLMERVVYLAGYLQECGLMLGERVAVSLPRGVEQVIAVLGVLVAGGVYVPVGIGQPEERKKQILTKSDVRLCISEKNLFSSIKRIDLSDSISKKYMPVAPVTTPKDLAYIIFTSGTTGEPKGVMVSHDGAWNTIADVNRRFCINQYDCALSVSSLDFDLSVYDIFGMLSFGGSLIMIPEDKNREAVFWFEVLKKYKVTVWNSVPAIFDMLVSCWEENPVELSLEKVMVSGDWVCPSLIERAFKINPSLNIFALGGATEASIWSSYYPVKSVNVDWVSVPYGRPLGNQQIRVVDDEGVDCANGVQGNICIGGRGVAKGYIGDSKLTEDKFVNFEGIDWYYTGDIGRYDDNGDIEFLGRKDRQIKLNGYRVEVGEIESNARKLEGVGNNFAMVVENGGTKHLALAYIPEVTSVAQEMIRVEGSVVGDPDSDKSIAQFMREIFDKYPELNNIDSRVIVSWKHWLDNFKESDNSGNGELLIELSQIMGLIADTLVGRRDYFWLLEHPYFSIDHLFLKDRGVVKGLEYIVSKVNNLFAKIGRLRVGLIDVRGELLPGYLIERLSKYVELIFIVRGASEKERLEKRLVNQRIIFVDGDMVPEESEFSFDLIVALNTMHQYKNVGEGIAFAYSLLKPGGRLLMMEQEELPSVGLVTSSVIENGFKDFENRKEPFSPMLKSKEWGVLLNSGGFVSVRVARMLDTATVVIDCRANDVDYRVVPRNLKEFLQISIPRYMVPEIIRMFYRVNLSRNGKVDVEAIKSLMGSVPQEELVMPASSTEIQVADLWKELLGVSAIGRNSSFFQLGGDSLLATRFLNKINKIYNFTYSLREMFDNPMLMDVACAIDKNREDLLMEEGVI